MFLVLFVLGAAVTTLPIDPLWFLVGFVVTAFPGFSWFIAWLFAPAWELKKTLAAVIALSGKSQEELLSSPWDVNRRLNIFKHALHDMKKQQDRPK
ncbi:MAG TPA: hypothetical protein VEF35_03190 [Candidatus Bathyarchaeia archaeon]|nr:hypothetical protein [Candidatus Bathyarchaeia archaeon]